MHVPVDDTHTYWYSFFTSFAGPLDKEAMRAQRLQCISLPDYVAEVRAATTTGASTPRSSARSTYLGMGEEDINLHDQWAVESMGAIQDRTREHLGTSDKVIMANRRTLLKAIETVRAGGAAADGAADAAQAAAHGRAPTRSTASRRPAPGTRTGAERGAAKRAGAPLARGARAARREAASPRPADDAASPQRCGVDDARARGGAASGRALDRGAAASNCVRIGWCDLHGVTARQDAGRRRVAERAARAASAWSAR